MAGSRECVEKAFEMIHKTASTDQYIRMPLWDEALKAEEEERKEGCSPLPHYSQLGDEVRGKIEW